MWSLPESWQSEWVSRVLRPARHSIPVGHFGDRFLSKVSSETYQLSPQLMAWQTERDNAKTCCHITLMTNRWTKLFWCRAWSPAAMSQPKFNSNPWLSNHSTLDCWLCKYVFRSPYTHSNTQTQALPFIHPTSMWTHWAILRHHTR